MLKTNIIITTILLISSSLFSYSQTTPVLLRNEGNFVVVEYQVSGTFDRVGFCWAVSGGDKPTAESGSNYTTIITTVPGTYRDSMPEGDLTPNVQYDMLAYVKAGSSYKYTKIEDKLIVTTKARIQPASPVAGLTISEAGKTRIVLDWADDAAGFYVVRYTSGSNPPDASSIPDGDGTTSPSDLPNVALTSNKTITGLSENTQYSFIVLPGDNYFANDYNLRQDDPLSVTGTTITAPATQASGIGMSSSASGSLNVSWSAGNGDSRLVMMNTSNSFTTVTDETTYVGDDSWNNSGEQCIYNGPGTSVTVTNVDLTQQYFFKVYEYNGTNYPAYNATAATDNPNPTRLWGGGTDASWLTTGNWQGSYTPNSSVHVTIPGGATNDPIIGSAASVGSLTIADGGNLTINGATLSVSGDVTIQGASGSSGIVCDATGSLSVSGTSIYERYIPADNWHLISIPNSNSSITQLTGLYVQSFDEATPEWVNLTSSSALSVGQGYGILYNDSAQTISFTGSFNNGLQSIDVTNADPSDSNQTYGWNLVGNPYPSAIDWGAGSGWNLTDVSGTAQIWNGTTYQALPYLSSNLIPPTQGFFVYATVNSGQLIMNDSVRTVGDQTFYKKSEYSNFKVNINREEKSDNFQIFFHPDASDEFDNIYDGYKLFSWVEEVPQIYTITNTDEKLLAINTINSNLLTDLQEPITIKLGYRTNIEGPLSINISHLEGFDEDIAIGIYDKLLNEYQDITNFPYEFTSDIGEFNDRFDLYITKNANDISNLIPSELNCYTHNNTLIINSAEPIKNGRVLVYDMLGRPVINKSLTTKTRHVFTIPEKTNIFVVNIMQDRTFLYRKTFVK